ncbi:hypothetical protein ACFY05_31780 [Microtetraspora fusca]|uniref:HNH endonuclease n=1 Tax=Microtetraspora fusca TaxID=1997 RepID=A0ABW6VDY9_MICFU
MISRDSFPEIDPELRALADAQPTDALCDTLEELDTNTERTAQENAARAAIIDVLEHRHPEVDAAFTAWAVAAVDGAAAKSAVAAIVGAARLAAASRSTAA